MTGDPTYRIIIGEESVYTFSVMDAKGNFSINVDGGLPQGAIIEESGGEYNYVWLVTSLAEFEHTSLAFVANGSKGAVSVLQPQLELCACANEGSCIIEGIRDITLPVIVMACNCSQGISTLSYNKVCYNLHA